MPPPARMTHAFGAEFVLDEAVMSDCLHVPVRAGVVLPGCPVGSAATRQRLAEQLECTTANLPRQSLPYSVRVAAPRLSTDAQPCDRLLAQAPGGHTVSGNVEGWFEDCRFGVLDGDDAWLLQVQRVRPRVRLSAVGPAGLRLNCLDAT